MKYLHDRLQEDEINIQFINGLDEKVIKNLVAQAVVSNFLLENQFRVTPKRVADIKEGSFPSTRSQVDFWSQQISRP